MRLLQFYLVIGFLVVTWYGIAAARGWQAVNFGFFDGMSSSSSSYGGGGYGGYGGRSFGGAWGGGK